ncbi:MAG: hypothetical protein R2780_04905 [Crocinitomicaceae bacterium]|nr:hypothetical protein [Crocinitomicaceae bacterium]
MTRTLFLAFILIILTACSGSSNGTDREDFVSETTYITDAYPPLNEECIKIMEQLQICTLSDTVLDIPPCTNKFFRVFDYRPNKEWEEGFIVEMIPGLYGSPVHQIVVIRQHLGKYLIVNQYLGKLMEIRTSFIGYSDLLIGYDDPDIGLVAIKHVWQGDKYEPVDVEEINNHFVKPEMKDSVNAIFLPAFNAGH